jgi:hypothetical protein
LREVCRHAQAPDLRTNDVLRSSAHCAGMST